MILETKVSETFPESQFISEGFSGPYRLDRIVNGWEIILHAREDIPTKYIKEITYSKWWRDHLICKRRHSYQIHQRDYSQ